jgi:hypothetical protein
MPLPPHAVPSLMSARSQPFEGSHRSNPQGLLVRQGTCAGSMHAPETSHVASATKSSGPVQWAILQTAPAGIGPHVPSSPPPFNFAVQALHGSLQSLSQQTPLTQKAGPGAQSPGTLHGVARAAGAARSDAARIGAPRSDAANEGRSVRESIGAEDSRIVRGWFHDGLGASSMPRMGKPARALAAFLLLAAPIGCRAPAEAIVDITTDACDAKPITAVSAGFLNDIEAKAPDTTTAQCTGDSVGSIVIVPPDGAEEDSPFAFKVVAGLGGSLDGCKPPDYGPQCIVARRAMRFVPNHPFHVPVRMSQACAGVKCPADQTCLDGACHSSTVDPGTCDTAAGCEPGGVAPPFELELGGKGLQIAHALAVGDDGTIAVVGTFDGRPDLGGGALASNGGKDMFVATYSQAGLFRWAKTFGGSGDDDALSVAIGDGGAVYVAGRFEAKVDFGGGKVTSKGAGDAVLIKLTSFGTFVWAQPFGGAEEDEALGVTAVAGKGVLVAGDFGASWSLGADKLTSAGDVDAFVARFGTDGTPIWARSIGGAGRDSAGAVAADGAGNAYFAGYFEQKMSPSSGEQLAAAGAGDVLFGSFDPAGTLRWAKGFGSKANDRAMGLAARGARVVMTGSLGGAVVLDGSPITTSSAGFVATFDGDGKLGWGKAFGDAGARGEGVALTDDSIVLGGEIGSGAVFGSKPIAPMGAESPFVAVLDSTGAPIWANAFKSSHFAFATGVGAAPGGFAVTAGWFTEKLDLGDRTIASQEAEDLFLLRIAPP